jgi:putative heme-binding domain-containing protein
MLATDGQTPAAVPAVLAQMDKEESPFVLHFAAGVSQRLPGADGRKLARLVEWRILETDEPNLALAGWYAVQKALAGTDRPADWTEFLEHARHPLIGRHVARYLVASAPPGKRDDRLAFLVSYLDEAKLDAAQLPVLAGVQDALASLRECPEPKGWGDLYGELTKSEVEEVRTRAEALAVLFGNAKALADLKTRAADAKAAPAARAAAIELLARRRVAELPALLHPLLTDAAVRGPAVRALAAVPDDTTAAKVLAAYSSFAPSEKSDAVQTLAARPAGALGAARRRREGGGPAGRRVARRRPADAGAERQGGGREAGDGVGHDPPRERRPHRPRPEVAWPSHRRPPQDRRRGERPGALHAALRQLPPPVRRGRRPRPDLTGSQRANLDYLLENVLDPSAVVPREFRVTNVRVTDGRLVSGVVTRDTPEGLTVRTTNETVVIPRGDVESVQNTALSIMPEGLFDALRPEEVRDLVAYLARPQQVPLPGTAPPPTPRP